MFLTWILKTGSEPIRKVICIIPFYFWFFGVDFKYGFCSVLYLIKCPVKTRGLPTRTLKVFLKSLDGFLIQSLSRLIELLNFINNINL
jgi:hypothetical protein